MSTGKYQNKVVFWYKIGHACLHIHVFISFSFLCVIFQAQRQLLSFMIHFTGTAIVKNKICF